MKIVFLDEYSLGGNDLSKIKALGDYTGYDRTTPEQVLERCQGVDIIITNKVYISPWPSPLCLPSLVSKSWTSLQSMSL